MPFQYTIVDPLNYTPDMKALIKEASTGTYGETRTKCMAHGFFWTVVKHNGKDRTTVEYPTDKGDIKVFIETEGPERVDGAVLGSSKVVKIYFVDAL